MNGNTTVKETRVRSDSLMKVGEPAPLLFTHLADPSTINTKSIWRLAIANVHDKKAAMARWSNFMIFYAWKILLGQSQTNIYIYVWNGMIRQDGSDFGFLREKRTTWHMIPWNIHSFEDKERWISFSDPPCYFNFPVTLWGAYAWKIQTSFHFLPMQRRNDTHIPVVIGN